jgi:hypothetical protein
MYVQVLSQLILYFNIILYIILKKLRKRDLVCFMASYYIYIYNALYLA